MTLDVPGAIEVGDFVSAFTSLASEYDRYVNSEIPGAGKDATMYVREVRQGSIVAILAPFLPNVADAMNQAVGVHEFVRIYGGHLRGFLVANGGGRPVAAKPNELKDFSEQVAAIANNPNSSIEVAAIEIEDGEHKVKAAFKFRTSEAQTIRDNVESTRHQIESRSGDAAERVLMVFTRTDVGTPAVGKSTGERVLIESISDKSLPLIYASELAEQRIKHEITEAEENVYKKGFVVDVIVETRTKKPIAYKVANVHQVIDLDD